MTIFDLVGGGLLPKAAILGVVFAHVGMAQMLERHPPAEFRDLVASSCLDCHDAETETKLNFEALGYQLNDPENFGLWVRIYDQVDSRAMPPEKGVRPEEGMRMRALRALGDQLRAFNHEQQKRDGRAGWRLLTNLEYENSLHDLLSIATPLQGLLPSEHRSGLNASNGDQGLSSFHIQAYLKATDKAIDSALSPPRGRDKRVFRVDYPESAYMKIWYDRPWADGGDNTKPLSDAVVAFKRTDFIWRTDRNGFRAKLPGRYRVTGEIRAYQARSPVSFLLYKAHGQQSQPSFLKAFDLEPEQTRTIELMVTFAEGEYLLPSFAHLLPQSDGKSLFQVGAKAYQGEGIAVKNLVVEGPLKQPVSVLMAGAMKSGSRLGSVNETTVFSLLKPFAEKAFRRPLDQAELLWLRRLVKDRVIEGVSLSEIIRSTTRQILSSPQFLYLISDAGPLDDYSLASRLSYFLSKGPPDRVLRDLAETGKLKEPTNVTREIDRLIDAPRFRRFVRDFAAHWLRLEDIDATTPDAVLYPEYNDVLRQAMLDETVYFLEYLIREDLDVTHLIDSNFTFLNRELALLYGLSDVKGQEMRFYRLPKNSPRGGLLAQAAIHKVTANGTETSPVRRGNFVLSQLFGRPSPPPPPDAGTLEPDIREARTMRERLLAHRNQPSCSRCHQWIDPPGFALESFDPIGGFRHRYRQLPDKGRRNRFIEGAKVDSSGVTSAGIPFLTISDFKAVLIEEEKKTNALLKNMTERLVIYATGAEIQFADRDQIQAIVQKVRSQGGGLRSLVHQIIDSDLFTHR